VTDANKRIIILGAASAIAEATARIWAAQGARLVIVARDWSRLDVLSSDLKICGASEIVTIALDCSKAIVALESNAMVELRGGLDIMLLAYGALGDQKRLEGDRDALSELIETNFTSAVAWGFSTSTVPEQQRSGVLLVIGSVSGDRGRRSNSYLWRLQRRLDLLVDGIAHKLAPIAVRAVIVKPGFIDTPMTAAFEKKGLLWAKPDAVAPRFLALDHPGVPASSNFRLQQTRHLRSPNVKSQSGHQRVFGDGYASVACNIPVWRWAER
jgi:decaprenylphospho-beta-D-erythro-pentofuranosid-2-ulose 2-reductase